MTTHREQPSRREFLKTVAAGAGAALAAPTLYANHHAHPTPQSLPFLDQRMYLHNMEIIGHVPGRRGGGMMMMSAKGGQRLLFQGADVLDVTDPRNPKFINKGGSFGGQLAYNAQLKKWLLMQASQWPYFGQVTPGGRYDDPTVDKQYREWNGFKGIRMYDATDPEKIVKISEFSSGKTGSGVHPDAFFYDGGKYAYLDTAPDETYTGYINCLISLTNCLMIVDVSDPTNIKEVSRWWVPGQRAAVPGETRELKKWKVLQGHGAELIPDKPLTSWEEATAIFKKLKYPAYDRFPFTCSHLPLYVPKRVEDGGTLGYGTWGAFGFIIHDLSDITKPKAIGRFDPTPAYGMDGIPFHTTWLGLLDRGYVVTVSEVLNPDCNESWLPCWVIDVRDPTNPVPVAQLPRPKAPPDAPYRDFCAARGRVGTHNSPSLSAPGRMSNTFLPLSGFNAGVRCFDLSTPSEPREVAYFVAPHGGELSPQCALLEGLDPAATQKCLDESASYNRPTDNVFVEWDRNIIYAGTTTGLYVLTTPALGRPILGALPITEWSLPKLNAGAVAT